MGVRHCFVGGICLRRLFETRGSVSDAMGREVRRLGLSRKRCIRHRGAGDSLRLRCFGSRVETRCSGGHGRPHDWGVGDARRERRISAPLSAACSWRPRGCDVLGRPSAAVANDATAAHPQTKLPVYHCAFKEARMLRRFAFVVVLVLGVAVTAHVWAEPSWKPQSKAFHGLLDGYRSAGRR